MRNSRLGGAFCFVLAASLFFGIFGSIPLGGQTITLYLYDNAKLLGTTPQTGGTSYSEGYSSGYETWTGTNVISGDISGTSYTFHIYAASYGSTNFRADLKINGSIVATRSFTVASTTYQPYGGTVTGTDPSLSGNSTVTLEIHHTGGSMGVIRWGDFGANDSYVVLPGPSSNPTISGTITHNGSPLAGVVMSGLPGNPTTNSSGFYTATVESGWTGTATPTLSGYSFTPASRSYSSVTSNQSAQDYTAALLTNTISGTITSGGSPLTGVVMSGLPGNPTTNGSGFYTATVNHGWSGTATPTLSGYTFTPASRSYSSVTSNQSAQDYSAVEIPASITVTSPNGGENWPVGSSRNITWTSSGTSGTVRIEYSTDNGTGWTDVIASTPDDGSYGWTVPNNPSVECLVRISDVDGSPSDISDGTFTISEDSTPAIVHVSPGANKLNVPGGYNISVIFDMDMNHATLHSGNFIVYAHQTGRRPGTYDYDGGTRTASFLSATPFAAGEVVTVTLTVGIESASGTPLEKPFTWSYTAAVEGGNGAFITPASTYAAGDVPMGTFAADFNGNGCLDLATANYNDNTVSILFNNGDGTFAVPATAYAVGSSPMGLFAGDFDGDGDVDLAVSNNIDNTVSVLYNNGDGTFGSPGPDYAVGNGPNAIIGGDFNGDGYVDLATSNGLSNTVSVLLNNGDGSFSVAASYNVGSSPRGIYFGDFDNDGDIDLATANYESGTVSILKNNGDGTYITPAPTYWAGGHCRGLFAADLDGDGDIDLVTGNEAYAGISVLKNNGDGTFGSATKYNDGDQFRVVFGGDFDGDGDVDLAAGGSKLHIFLNHGDGTFAPAVMYDTSGPAYFGLTGGDLNGDGGFDIAFSGGGTVYVLLNPACSISGVITSGGSPLAGVVMNGLPGDPVTDASGVYQGIVSHGWSGTVTPTLYGYAFTPGNRVYSDVTSDQVNQDYSATLLPTYTISGTVTWNGSSLAGVVLDGLPGNPTTTAEGFYTATVVYGWSGTVTPTLSGYTFTPETRSYSGVSADQTNQNFSAIIVTFTISGSIAAYGAPLAGVAISGLPGPPVTDASGDYSATVNYGWSGTATPTLGGYVFTPDHIDYVNVTADALNQDYMAASEHEIPAIEREALIALYNATNGDSWTNNSGWKTPPLHTDGFAMPGTEGWWYGVAELDRFHHVQRIEMNSNNLTGMLPQEIGMFSHLTALALGFNEVSGQIPSSIGNLTDLAHLSLNNNQLSGGIPAGIWLINSLYYMALSGNQLTGTIPEEVGDLKNLCCLRLAENNLTGSIPPQIANMTSLKDLGLSSNQLSGPVPSEIWTKTNWQYLWLDGNQLSGTLPGLIGNLSGLRVLNLHKNQFSGNLPAEIGNLVNLRLLRVSHNQLTGEIPAGIANLVNLDDHFGSNEIRYNGLYTNDPTLIGFLNEKDPDWAVTQTIAPENVAAAATSSTTANVTWDAIPYAGNTGGYRVHVGTASGGPYTFFGQTADKTATSMPVTGLIAGTPYYFVVSTRTDPHDEQQNTVDSEYSEEAVTTTFQAYTVMFLAGAGGTLTGETTQTVDHGSDCSAVTAVPNTGFGFAGWLGDHTGMENPLTVTNVTKSMTIFANFAINQYTVTFVEGAGGTITGDKVQTVNHGGSTTAVTAMAGEGRAFAGWTGDYTGSANPLTLTNVTSNMTVTANFVLKTYKITATAGANGSIDPSGEVVVNHGSDQAFDISANSGYLINDVLVDGVSVGAVGSYTFTNVTADHTIAASFTPAAFTISGTVTDGGNPLSGAVITFSYNGHTETTGAAGTYSYVVDHGTTTTLTPSHADYGGWTPATRTITAIDGDRTNQDFAGAINVPPAPVLSSPADNAAVSGTSIEFMWQPAARADRYKLEVRKSSDDSLFKSAEPGNNTSHTLSGFPNDGTSYRWRVQAGNATGWGTWTAYRSLINGAAPARPASITYPSTSITGKYSVSWAASAGAASYRLERSSNGGTTWTQIYSGAALSHPEAVPNGSYRYRVRASNLAGDSTFRAGTHDCAVNIAPPAIGMNKTRLNFGAVMGGPKTDNQSIIVNNTGGGTLDWTAAGGAGWLGVAPLSGTGTSVVTVSVNPTGLAVGTYTSQVAFTAPGASNSPQAVDVTLNVYPQGGSSGPFGVFDTPMNGATVYGAVPVTGWALDDVQVQKVEVKRSPHATDPAGVIGSDGLVFISDAIFIDGARPDVEAAFPQHPLNYRAGWGYMLLTNMLPNQGNDVFTLHAFAVDKEGTRVKLGQKTITGNNAGSAKPFGTIDTPGQGEQISGAAFNNFGWALTPQPNMIPTDGSTIRVWVDGASLGHPAYNYARPALAALFPGLANTNGPVGLYVLNTTAFANGVHTIAWSAVDSGGNAEGLGSRFFSVLNLGGAEIEGTGNIVDQTLDSQDELRNNRHERTPRLEVTLDRSALNGLATNMTSPVYMTKGYDMSRRPDIVHPDLSGGVDIVIEEVERVELLFGAEALERGVWSDRSSGRGDGAQPHSSAYAQQDKLTDRGCKSIDRGFGSGAQSPMSDRMQLDQSSDMRVGSSTLSGYLLVGDELRPLPIGSMLDPASGVFAWQPGPGFLGEYTFAFVREHAGGLRGGLRDKTFVRITIVPKF